MKRGTFAVLTAFRQTTSRLFRVFLLQRLGLSLALLFALILISLVFAFVAFAPVLSPFVYPLF